MTFTYDQTKLTDDADPNADLYRVRFLVQDTDTSNVANQLLSDEGIRYLLTQADGPLFAAINAARAIAAQFSRYADATVGPTSYSYSQRARMYRDVVSDLEAAAGGSDVVPVPIATGLSLAEKAAVYAEPDRNATIFAPGFMDNPRQSWPEGYSGYPPPR